ncbi:DNA-3-methyladenine glycosylase I [Magnetospirillum moscoviense]|uniref:DNA-3-methyladenine glycosylase n=1 Tax=Magnetospirillum moscoviense TaxID=1437059 RepID=A0A178MJI5_9PROT|nr:DNA-3-methyladenine glycosylase I [Magnetospirillum moscoviense]OAN48836.1 DNA-3-methyladenine glycosylase [Magnetospirillum moscoviense]
MSWYCDVAPGHPVHQPYHDLEYGFPQTDDKVLFERLTLEIFQAGLSWEITLKKRAGLVAAFEGFDPAHVALYGEADIERLMADARIIRNRRKIGATIENAKRLVALVAAHESFAAWIKAHHPLTKPEWVKLFKKTFVFMGGEVVGEFLMSIGYLPGAHREDCPTFQKIAPLAPAWMDTP